MTVFKGFPSRPSSRTLVLFAHFDPQGVVDPHVVYLVEALRRLPASVVFVSSSRLVSGVELIAPLCDGIFSCADNRSFDPGLWHHGWLMLREHGWSFGLFDRVVLVNDTVYGPLFALSEMWGTFEGADLFGALESWEVAPHLQATFLVWEVNARTLRFLEGEFAGFEPVSDKVANIVRYEVGWSVRAREAGLSVVPFVSAEAARGKYGLFVGRHPWVGPMSVAPLDGVNHALFFWDGLIECFRYPFLKVRVLQPGWPGAVWGSRWREVLGGCGCGYPAGLIEGHVVRCGPFVPVLGPAFERM